MSTEKSEVLERERRWTRPAGIASILGAIAIQAGFIIGGSALEGDGTAERLLEASGGDADGQLLMGVLITGAGFLLAAVPLTFFFLAARARSERVRGALAPIAAVGAILIAGGLVFSNVSYLDAADNFAADEAQREAEPAPATEPGADQEEPGAQGGGQEGAGGEPAPAGGQGAGSGEERTTTVEPTTTTTGTTGTDAAESEEDAEDEADDRADDALADASGASASALLVRGGALAFALGFFYTALWCMRTGLLSRFWGSLGMASAVVLALFFLYFFSLVWFLAMGLFLLGAWFGPRPPAWETGEATPWVKPGEQPPDAGGGTIEGEGRDLGGAGAGEDSGGTPPEPPYGPGDDGPGEPPRKRKRRR